MLRLEGLSLSGFKSFADRTELILPDGVTCVVGPNGCGKSNVVDSVAWVLGEQSPRLLRGTRMEDVIFAGTKSRKPAGMAEVSLHFAPRTSPVAAPERATRTAPAEMSNEATAEAVDPASSEASEAAGPGTAPDAAADAAAHLEDDVDPRLQSPLAITRRLYRNGDSEYLINGERARLRDITGLLMGTGMGTRLYSIIEQGRVDQILNSKPIDRRGLIEEAAGITRYKTRRKAARLKLDESQQSLLRVSDIIGELEKQLRSLKRQASSARRYRRLSARRRIVLRALHAVRHERLRDRLATAEVELSGLRQAEEQGRTRLASLEDEAGRVREAVAAAERERDSAASEAHALELEVERARQVVASTRERILDLTARSEKQVDLEQQLSTVATATRAALAEVQQGLALVETELSSGRAALEARLAAAQDTRVRLGETHRSIATLKEDIFEVMSEAAGLRNRKMEVEATRQRLETQAARHAEALKQATELAERAQGELAKAQDHLKRALAGEEDVKGRAARHAEALAEALARTEAVAREHVAARQQHDEAAWQLAALRETLRTRAVLSEAVRTFLDGEPVGAVGTVAELVRASEGDELAAEKGLGALLQAVAFTSRAEAEAAARSLAGTRACEVAFAFPGADPQERHALPHVSGARLLSSCVVLPAPLAWLADLVPAALVVDSADEALRLARQHGDVTFVSRDGVVIGPGGQGSAGRPRGEGEGPLEIRAREEKLATETAQLLAVTEARAAELARLEAERARLASEREELQAAVSAAEVEVVSRRHETHARRELAEAAEGRLSASRLQEEAVRSELAAAVTRIEDAERGLESCATSHGSLSASLTEAHAAAGALEGAAEEHGLQVAKAREAAAVLAERREAAVGAMERCASESRSAESRLQAAAEEAASLAKQRKETESLVARTEERIVTWAEQGVQRKATLLDREENVRSVRASVVEGGDRLRGLRAEHDRTAKSATEAALRRERLAADLEHLALDCQRDLGVAAVDLPQPEPPRAEPEADAEGVVAEAGGTDSGSATPPVTVLEGDIVDPEAAPEGEEAADLPVSEDLPWVNGVLDVESLMVEAESLRGRIDRIGPVNLVAIEEYDEIDERHRFLATEQADLLASIASLEETISRIDQLSRERFLQAFEAVKVTFDQAFQSLFRGGRAELRLQDDQDPLECGIEIIAQPPGKRLQNMMLLSGGEKALTAIALLFALFRYRPSPFCILDEVDAPLDESNVVRFIQLVAELATDTQFIVVTHNRRSMERAKVLYGVTMEEPGCSKLVSVRFDAVGESAA